MITSLSLENWKSHSSSSFSFAKGTNVLVGRMGSGKSSVLDALCFALYGTFPKMSRRDQTVEDLVNSSSGASAAEVRLEFEKGGKKYSVMRKAGKKSSEAEVHSDGKLAQKGPKAVTDYVTGALGVDYELFTRAIYSEQNRIDHLLTLNPRQRKGEIDWLLGLGQFDTAREAAQSAHGKLAESAEAYSREAEPQRVSELQQKMGQQGAELAARKANHAALQQQVQALSGRLAGMKQEMLALEKLRAAHQSKKTECDVLSGALQRLKKEAEGRKKPSTDELEAAGSAYRSQQQSLLTAKQGLQNLQNSLSNLKSEIGILENGQKLAQARAKKAADAEGRMQAMLKGKGTGELELELQKLKDEAEKLSSRHAELHAAIEGLVSAVDALSSAGAKCPVCDSDLAGGKAQKISGEKKELLGAKQSALAAAGAELKEKKAAIIALERRIYDLSILSSELSSLRADGIDVAVFASEVARKKEAKEKSDLLLAAAQKEVSALESALDRSRAALEDAQRAARLFDDMEGSQGKLALAQAEIAQMGFSEDAYEEKRKAYEELRLQSGKLEAEAAGAASQMRPMEELLASLENELLRLQEKGKLAAAYGSAAESMAIYKNSLTAAQSELRASLVEEINEALCEVWPAVYPYSDYAGVKIEADEKDYRLLMEKSGAWREVDSIASGGERACLCLALRIAFATVLTPDIGVLILDEPTHNLDSDAVLLLSEAINTKIPSIVEQTFVITHDTALGESSEGRVFRLERDKGKNGSTRVGEAG